MAELHFWRTNLDSFKVRDCFLSKKPQSFVYSDASATGCGSVITLKRSHMSQTLGTIRILEEFDLEPELAATDFALESFAPVLRGSLFK